MSSLIDWLTLSHNGDELEHHTSPEALFNTASQRQTSEGFERGAERHQWADCNDQTQFRWRNVARIDILFNSSNMTAATKVITQHDTCRGLYLQLLGPAPTDIIAKNKLIQAQI